MKRGKFIVFEGGEGSGKTTAITYVRSRLGNDDFIYTREPGGTPVAERIRALFLEREAQGEKFTVLTDLLLISAARAQHVENLIRPMFEEGRHVICDRFDLGTYAYQIAENDRRDLIDTYQVLVMMACGGGMFLGSKRKTYPLQPDLYLYLDVDAEIARQRALSRSGKQTSFDKKGVKFYEAIRKGFDEVITTLPDNKVRRIDAGKSPEEVGEDVLSAIRELTNLP